MLSQGPSGYDAKVKHAFTADICHWNRDINWYAVIGNCSCLCKMSSHHSVFCWSLGSPTDEIDHLDSHGISQCTFRVLCGVMSMLPR